MGSRPGGWPSCALPPASGRRRCLPIGRGLAKSPVGWLSLDPEDNDPARFCRYMIAALHRAGGLDERIRALFTDPVTATSQGAVSALLNELGSRSDQLVLVLDDYHVIESQMIHESVAFLLSHLPAQLQVVIASRSDPPFPWRGCGRTASSPSC